MSFFFLVFFFRFVRTLRIARSPSRPMHVCACTAYVRGTSFATSVLFLALCFVRLFVFRFAAVVVGGRTWSLWLRCHAHVLGWVSHTHAQPHACAVAWPCRGPSFPRSAWMRRPWWRVASCNAMQCDAMQTPLDPHPIHTHPLSLSLSLSLGPTLLLLGVGVRPRMGGMGIGGSGPQGIDRGGSDPHPPTIHRCGCGCGCGCGVEGGTSRAVFTCQGPRGIGGSGKGSRHSQVTFDPDGEPSS